MLLWGLLLSASVAVADTTLPDFDADGVVGFGDFILFAGAFGTAEGEEGFSERYDLNGDGSIGFSDFVLFAGNFGKDASGEVAILDENLRKTITQALGKEDDAPITEREMSTLTRIRAYSTVSDLTGLEFAHNLIALIVSSVKSKKSIDLAPLGKLTKLDTLRINGGKITSLAPLTNLRLVKLDVGYNEITDLTVLANMRSLKDLRIYHNPINDISPLRNLPIESLDIGNTNCDNSAITTLRNFVLRIFLSDYNDLTNITGLQHQTALAELSLAGNNISDISALGSLTGIRRLHLSHNNIVDISALGNLTEELNYLDLSSNHVVELTALGQFYPFLWYLDLTDNEIMNISGLASFVTGQPLRLMLGFNEIRDISALGNMNFIRRLDLAGNRITDMSPLINGRSAGYMYKLNLLANEITDTTGVGAIATELEVAGNPAVDTGFGDFHIELVFTHDFSLPNKRLIQEAANKWMMIIQNDVPDIVFDYDLSNTCGAAGFDIETGEKIDDVRIYVGFTNSRAGVAAGAGDLPKRADVGCVWLWDGDNDAPYPSIYYTMLHEIGHVLGVAIDNDNWRYFVKDNSRGESFRRFSGPLAIAAFDDAGGESYPINEKVPLLHDGHHWTLGRWWINPSEVMESTSLIGNFNKLSAFTIQALADIGYEVYLAKADPYELRANLYGLRSADASSKIVLQDRFNPLLTCGGVVERPNWKDK